MKVVFLNPKQIYIRLIFQSSPQMPAKAAAPATNLQLHTPPRPSLGCLPCY